MYIQLCLYSVISIKHSQIIQGYIHPKALTGSLVLWV